MNQRETALFKFAWVALAVNGAALLLFGLIAAAWPSSGDTSSMRAIGVASIGMGLFGASLAALLVSAGDFFPRTAGVGKE